jgi:orotate phosphoribosyltransferase
VPLAAATALATGIPFLIVRKAAKDYATEGLIEGVFEAGERVLVIEDVVTTGGALIAAVGALRAAGLDVRRALCVLDREEGGAEGLAAVGVRLDPLFRRADLGIPAG